MWHGNAIALRREAYGNHSGNPGASTCGRCRTCSATGTSRRRRFTTSAGSPFPKAHRMMCRFQAASASSSPGRSRNSPQAGRGPSTISSSGLGIASSNLHVCLVLLAQSVLPDEIVPVATRKPPNSQTKPIKYPIVALPNSQTASAGTGAAVRFSPFEPAKH